MAHKKGQGSSRNGRDSNPSYLGLKVADGQTIQLLDKEVLKFILVWMSLGQMMIRYLQQQMVLYGLVEKDEIEKL